MSFGWGEFFSIACAACWALAVVLFRRSGETLPAFELNFFKNLVGLALLIPTLAVVHGLAPPGYSGNEWGLVILSGFIGIAVADTWYLKALNYMGASRTAIVAGLFAPFVVLLSIIYLDEILRPIQYGGLVLVLGGISLVAWKQSRQEVSPQALRRGMLFGAGAVFFMAVGVVMVKEILETREFIWTVTLRLAAGVAGMALYLTIFRGWTRLMAAYRRPQPWKTIVFASVLGTYVSMILWLGGYSLTKASIASMLNETQAAFIVLFAWLILAEPLTRRKLFGLALTFTGVMVVVM